MRCGGFGETSNWVLTKSLCEMNNDQKLWPTDEKNSARPRVKPVSQLNSLGFLHRRLIVPALAPLWLRLGPEDDPVAQSEDRLVRPHLPQVAGGQGHVLSVLIAGREEHN